MTNKHKDMRQVLDLINMRGMEDCFTYHEFKDIDNKTFHRLRERYVKAAVALLKYVEKHAE